jgi:hypothetical protein
MACWPRGCCGRGHSRRNNAHEIFCCGADRSGRRREPGGRDSQGVGATGLTILKGKGLRHNERKTFLGLGLERKESLLLCVVEKQLAMRILRSVKVQMKLDLPGGGLASRCPWAA